MLRRRHPGYTDGQPGEWLGIGAPHVTLFARVGSREYTIEIVDSHRPADSFIVDADDAVIRVSNVDPVSNLNQALRIAREQERVVVSVG
jgi:hypothetical protein